MNVISSPIYLLLALFLVALLLSAIIYMPILKFARNHQLFDNPQKRKLQRNPVPVLGGIVVFLSTVLASQGLWLFYDCSSIIFVELLCFILLVLGCYDDIRSISPNIRFVAEVVVAVLLVFVCGCRINNFHYLFGVSGIPQWLSWMLTILTVVGVINAVNMIDGVDGLSSGICIVAFGMFSILFFLARDYLNATLAVTVVGALIPFYIHNVFGKYSKMFIGDSGTMMLGMLLSYFIITALFDESTVFKFHDDDTKFGIIPFCCATIAIPLADTLRVMTSRILKGKSPFLPDKTHLHHAFIRYGFTHLETSIIIVILNSSIIGLWWLVYKSHLSQDWQFFAVLLSAFAICILLYSILDKHPSEKEPR